MCSNNHIVKRTIEIELRKIDVVKCDLDRGDLYLSFDYIFEGKSFGSFSELSIARSDLMVSEFIQNLIEAPQVQNPLDEDISIRDKDKIQNRLKDYFKKFVVSRAEKMEGVLTEEDKNNLNTSGLDLKDQSQSLDQKSTNEKIEILLLQAKRMIACKSYFLALETIQKVLKLDLVCRMAYFYKGLCHEALNELPEAEVSFRKWKGLSGVHIREPYIFLARVLIALHRYQDGLKLFDEYLENFPDDLQGILWKAQIYFKLHQKRFIRLLDRAYLENEDVVRDFLRTNWDYNQPAKEKSVWLTPKLSRAFLNMNKDEFAELVKSKFIPSHFDEEECRFVFNKEELRNWSEITTRYKLFDRTYQSSPELLREAIQAIRWERKKEENKLKQKGFHKKYLPPTSQTIFEFLN